MSAYEAMEGKFNYNATPLAPPGIKSLIYEAPSRRTAWAPHAIDGWYLGPAMKHYRCGRYFIPSTRAVRIASTTKHFPTHCSVPTISEADRTLLAAAELINIIDTSATLATKEKIKHAQILKELTAILKNEPVPRVEDKAEPRVGRPSSSNDTTAPKVVRAAKRIHLRRTRRNTPMETIPETAEEDEEPPTAKSEEATPKTVTQQTSPPPRIARVEYESPGPPIPLPTFTIPMPKGRRAPRVPIISQDEDAPAPPPAPPARPSPPRPRRSTRLKSQRFSNQALAAALANAFEGQRHVPRKLEKDGLQYDAMVDLQELCCGVVHPVTKETITNYKKLANDPLLKEVWTKAMCKELGNIAQGFGDEKGTNTVKFLTHAEIAAIPKDRRVTYARIVVDYRPQKDDPNRVRITVGGNLLDYPGELTTRTADLTTTKLLWNSVVSTKGARYKTADIKSFYLETPLDRYEYMRMPFDIIPAEFADAYNLHEKVKDGYVYMEIQKGMYGLPAAGMLANRLLKERLKKDGYFELPHTPGLWTHNWRPITFSLVVDDFGIKYVGEQHFDHLIAAIKRDYTVEVDETGGLYCGISLDWNYAEGYVDISMPGYVLKQLTRYDHTQKRKAFTPYDPGPVRYGKASQNLPPPDDSTPLDEKGKRRVQQVVGSFLYYARAVDVTILTALSEIAGQQSKPTEKTMDRVNHFLDYMATNPDAKIRYYGSDMVLNVHSDASYLTAPGARSRAGGHFFLGSIPKDGCPIRLNGAVLALSTILRCVAASAAEAELGALFLNAQEAKIMRLTLEEMGHPQPPTPIHCDNTTAVGIVHSSIKRQRSRAMNMRYFWLLCQEAQRILAIRHHPGQENLGDYQTKHHNSAHHKRVRPFYQHTEESPRFLPRAQQPSVRRGCVETGANQPYLHRTPLPKISSRYRPDAAPAA